MKASDKKRIENKPGFISWNKTSKGNNDYRYVIYSYYWQGEKKQGKVDAETFLNS